ncbi:MAG TPA: hemerythrin domain-containing protein [Mycobacteriales bacterium]|nr:hemerythrin domain-containing protein [Mycobacteriales bacterium]
MRSVAQQSVDELGGQASLLVRQRRDHAKLDVLLDRLAATSGPEQDETLRALYRLVFPHAFAEESVVWPVVRATLPDGQELTVRNEQEHQEINELVARLERTPHGDPGRAALIDRVSALLRQDARDEEDLILPRLQAALDGPRLRRLGRTWELVRRTAPTRPHPVVARRPPGNVVAALPLSLLDRTRDGLERAGRRAPGPLPGLADRSSRLLGGLAGALEHVPPLTRGEDPSTHSGRTG